MNKGKKIDWSEKSWKDMLVYQRKSMWLEDTVEKLALWLGLKSGMTAVDVGCGLGYLGYTYWPYFGKDGRYLGVDKSPELIKDAEKTAKDWAKDGEASFVVSDVYNLSLTENFADLVMCQALLQHLEKPELALAEMVRIAKPGGIIMCQEPDNLSAMLVMHYSSLPELNIEEQLLSRKIALIYNQGRIKLGQGDWSIGIKVPRMMNKLGLTEIGIRLNDRVHYLEPPYQGTLQQDALEKLKKELLDEQRHKIWMERLKEGFLAGGGKPEDFEHYRGINQRTLSILGKQIEEGEYFACSSGDVYIIKGRKPFNKG